MKYRSAAEHLRCETFNIRQRASRARRRKRKSLHRREKRRPVLVAGRVTLSFPGTLRVRVRQAHEDVVPLLRKMGMLVLGRRTPVHLDFSYTRTLTVEGALLLAAEVDRTVQLARFASPLTCTPPKANKARQVLQQIGLFERIGHTIDVRAESEDVVHWRTAKGGPTDAEVAGEFVEPYQGSMATAASRGLYAGMVEAMTNSVDHAYTGRRADGYDHMPVFNWWLFSQEREGMLTVVLCDLGIGIPKSLPLTQEATLLQGVLSHLSGANSDARAIQAALEIGKTQTGKAQRGKGLADILRVVDRSDDGQLFILSNRGGYSRRKHAGEVTDGTFRLKSSICGTIIGWRIPTG